MVRHVQFKRRNSSSPSKRERERERMFKFERLGLMKNLNLLPRKKVNPSPLQITHCIYFNLNESKILQDFSFRFKLYPLQSNQLERNSSKFFFRFERKKKFSSPLSLFLSQRFKPDIEHFIR